MAKRVSVLVAEDETIIRLDLRAQLEDADYVVCGEAPTATKPSRSAAEPAARPRGPRREDAGPGRDRGGEDDPRRATRSRS